jgi:rhombotail lipoprotein
MKRLRLACTIVLAAALSSCSAMNHLWCAPNCQTQNRNSSSLVGFLYPGGEIPPPENAIPELKIPLRVGLAFLPSSTPTSGLDAAHRQDLLERIKSRFADRKFVREIVIVPDYYLANNRGFAGLEGVQRLYAVDLMALVSYDQITHTDDNKLSLGYLTIVGAYVLRGTSHDTTTLVDLAVVDPATRSLVLRAGGTDTRAGNSTLIDVDRDARSASAQSFDAATGAMIGNFDTALTGFETSVREGKANVRVVNRDKPGGATSGGGSLGYSELLVMFLLLAARRHLHQVVRPASRSSARR